MAREKFTTTLDKELKKNVRKKMIDDDIKTMNELIERLLKKWLK